MKLFLFQPLSWGPVSFFFFILFPSYYKKWRNGYVVLICLSGLNYSSPERKAQICHHMTSSEICSSWENNNCYRLYTHTMIFLCTWAQGFHFSGWESLLYLWHYSGFSSTLNQCFTMFLFKPISVKISSLLACSQTSFKNNGLEHFTYLFFVFQSSSYIGRITEI